MTAKHPAEIFFSAPHPLNRYLNVRYQGIVDDTLTVELEAPASFRADEHRPEVHSGLATLILDTVMGGAVMGFMDVIRPIATTGLTVQHLRRARAGDRLSCRARQVGMHLEISHMTGELLDAEGRILSIATGTFMLGTRAKPLGARV